MKKIIRVGSRESKLAVMQTELVIDEIKKYHKEIEFELVKFKTTGDKILDKTLDKIGGKGLFVKELNQALLTGKIDIAVHSLKDMPMEEKKELAIAAYVKRGDPRDVLVLPDAQADSRNLKDRTIEELVHGINGAVGSSSARRQIQLRNLCKDIKLESIRGNIITRLNKLDHKEFGALVLAGAGLNRAGLQKRISRYFSAEEMLPAAGQGILAVQARDDFDIGLLKEIDHPETRIAALAERSFVRTLDGGCSSPIAAYGQLSGNSLYLRGLYYEENTGNYWVGSMTGDAAESEKIGYSLAIQLRNKEKEKSDV